MVFLRRLFAHPPYLLILANVFCAAIGLAQGLTVAALLGPANFGVIAIPVMLGWLASNFWDIRLTDVATKLHFSTTDPVAQTASVRACLELSFGIAVLMVLSSVALSSFALSLFTDTPLPLSWIWLQALALGLNHMTSATTSLMRLSGSYVALALNRVLSQVAYTLLLLTPLFIAPTLGSYYSALLTASCSGLLLAGTALFVAWRKKFAHCLWEGNSSPAMPTYMGQWRMLLSGNVMGYSKMMYRAGDVLLLGYFADDKVTGIYRLAKSMADGLGSISDGLYNYYYPTFLSYLQKREYELYARTIRRFVVFGFGGALLLGVCTYIGLQMAERYVLQHQYLQLAEASAIMMACTGFVWGVHLWLWPLLVNRGRVDLLATTSMIGALAQMALIASLCNLYTPAPAMVALSLFAYYVIAYAPLLLWWRISWRELS